MRPTGPIAHKIRRQLLPHGFGIPPVGTVEPSRVRDLYFTRDKEGKGLLPMDGDICCLTHDTSLGPKDRVGALPLKHPLQGSFSRL